MKHPVDTSTWGEFKARDLFGPSKLGKYHNPKDLRPSDKGYEYICATTMNNGINQTLSCVIGDDLTIPFIIGGGLSLTPSHIIAWGKQNPYFTYHENPCVTSQGMYFVEVKNKTRNQIHFLITILNKLSSRFSYTNCLTGKIFDELSIPLPLKQGTNPADYSQDDIDWDYMESFMSRVQDAAKERLANLPEPGQKSKTPVDVSSWGEFKVGELFDMFTGRRLKKGDFEDGDIPFVMASSYNNGVVTTLSNPISTNENFLTADIFGNVFYHKELVGYGDDNCGLKLKYREGSANEYLFLATMISSISVHASFTNKLRGPWYIEQTIKLPLKPSAVPSNYTQDDIDWDYIEQFMEQFQKLAKNRVGQLTSTPDCDILTV